MASAIFPIGKEETRIPTPSDAFSPQPLYDGLGPSKVLHLYDPQSGMKGIVVVDNTACGPAIGGVRMAPDVTTEEVFRLARAMTLKNAAAGLPHGGGKSGILADPAKADKATLVRAFARAIRGISDYIPGPDMGTDESCMGWIHDEIGRAVGLPRVLGGIPLDEIGATGYGVACCAEVAAPFCGLDLKGARLLVEGYGNVGRAAARFLERMGAVLVAASDSGGATCNPNGISAAELAQVQKKKGTVAAYPKGDSMGKEELFALPGDILIPAARPDSIHPGNVDSIQARLILQGANIPATAEAELSLHRRGVLSIPDFIANAGGVICAAVEYHGGSEAAAFEQISEKIRRNTRETLEQSLHQGIDPRQAAAELARQRVEEAKKFRRR